MKQPFVEAIHDAVQRSSVSVKHIAAELDKSPSSLYNELNPFPWDGSTAKLGLEDAIRICELINDYTPLDIISHHCGFSLKKQDHDPDGHSFEHECLQGYQAVARFIDAAQRGAACSELAPLCNQAVTELEDVVKRATYERVGLRHVRG